MDQRCVQCASRDVTYDEAAGATICVSCGAVLEESDLVSDAFALGTTTAAEASFRCASRTTTLANGQREINLVASQLQLKASHVKAANRFFLLALQYGIVRGQRHAHVAAACLYVAGRVEKTPHMLIDYADALSTNSFRIGASFHRLARAFGLQLPLVDPSLFIHRFASRLQLADKAHAVSTLALRLCASMKVEIAGGRRPAGVCGAALLVAARAHGFARSVSEVAQVVQVAEGTLRARLRELAATSSGALTVRELSVNPEALACETGPLELTAPPLLARIDGPSARPAEGGSVEAEEPPPPGGNLSDLSDGELEAYLVADPHEVTAREQVWDELNFDYISRKRQRDDDAAAHAAAGTVARKKRSRKAGESAGATGGPVAHEHFGVAGEPARSTKLNYGWLALRPVSLAAEGPGAPGLADMERRLAEADVS